MRTLVLAFVLMLLLNACEAGNFSPKRNRLHNIGREGICQQNPSRCIDGTNIDW